MVTKYIVSLDVFNINPINVSYIPLSLLHKINVDHSLTHILQSQNPEIIKRRAKRRAH